MIERDEELASLQNTYRGIREAGSFLVIEGEAGIGKTRLAEEFLTRLRASGTVVIAAQCYPGQASMAYAPLVEGLRRALVESARADWSQVLPPLWLNESARLLPELSPKGVDPTLDVSLDSPGAQIRFYEGLTQVLLAICGNDPPGVLFLDDLQWADEATIDFLTLPGAQVARASHLDPGYLDRGRSPLRAPVTPSLC